MGYAAYGNLTNEWFTNTSLKPRKCVKEINRLTSKLFKQAGVLKKKK